MPCDSARPRPRYLNWLLAAALSGAIAVTVGTSLTLGVPSGVHAAVPTPLYDGLTAYSRPHATSPASVAPVPPAPVSRSVVRIAAPQHAPTPLSYHNRLISSDGSINTSVGFYSDCNGRTALSHALADIDTCVGGRTYFVGHNPGVFTPLFHMGLGTIITWFDGGGNAHRLRIIGVRTWHRPAAVLGPLGGAIAQFQTCITPDSSLERIMDAAPA
ncbi:MAG TPA: hypothetical protein VLO10_01290 [Candidatus Deferrimicrobium sp.]|nr:hypothetical protein [Candidatus Deferrimicrobium sp.]